VRRKILWKFVKDLFHVLPSHKSEEWEEISQLSPSRPTVILVSGFGATSRNLSIIRKRLLKDGFNVLILALDWNFLEDNVRGLYRMAERLSSLITQLKKRPGMSRNKIYLVAHSAGGLVARYYVQRLGGDHYCEGLVTLATPHRGTWMAGLGFCTHLLLKARCLWQMLPISGFVRELDKGHFPIDFPMVSIFSAHDLLCPTKSTLLSPDMTGESKTVHNLEIGGLSHGEFLTSKRCYKVLVQFLTNQLHPQRHQRQERSQ
jgi:pimeloyl-ACP methyl ester carboxylesterase